MLEMQKHADALNAELGLSARAAGELVATTFAAGRVNIPQPDAAALQRLPARKAVISRRNETLERILKNPPPRGAVIRFTDGKLRPRPPSERGMPAWLASNNTGVLVSVRKSSGSIRLRMESWNAAGGDDYYRTFDVASPLTFYVETIPVPGELIDLDLLPSRLRSLERRARATPTSLAVHSEPPLIVAAGAGGTPAAQRKARRTSGGPSSL